MEENFELLSKGLGKVHLSSSLWKVHLSKFILKKMYSTFVAKYIYIIYTYSWILSCNQNIFRRMLMVYENFYHLF